MSRFSIYQIPVAQRAAYLAEQKARGAAEKARKLALAKTCQCCFRQIFAETGTIAHHGYERPGYGWQTASCIGAKHLPLEASRDRLGYLIGLLKNKLADEISRRTRTAAEEIPVTFSKQNFHAKGYARLRDYPVVTLEFTRANFEMLVDENTNSAGHGEKVFSNYDGFCMKEKGFDHLLKADLAAQDQQIGFTRGDLKTCEKYYADWKQTHRWDKTEKTWVAL